MTREEAIGHLHTVIIYSENDGYTDEVREALKMAIESLDEEYGEWISEIVEGEDWKGCKRQYYQPISCSKCHSSNHRKSTYCPNCGRKMEGAEK